MADGIDAVISTNASRSEKPSRSMSKSVSSLDNLTETSLRPATRSMGVRTGQMGVISTF